MAGLRHVSSMLTESYTGDKPGESESENRNRRVDSHIAAQEGALDMLRERGGLLDARNKVAVRRAAAEGAAGLGPFYVGGADNDPATPEETIEEPPCSYTLSSAQHADVANTLDLHGIEVAAAGQAVSVSMGQPARTVIPLLLDERAEYHLVAGTPVACD